MEFTGGGMQENTGYSGVDILLVEDDEVDVETVRRRLKKENIQNQLHHADSGTEALAMLRAEGRVRRPCILLLDLNLPRMNGLELLQEIRKDAALKQSVVFVLTTSAREEDKAAAYGLSVAGYFLKENLTPFVEMLGRYARISEFPSSALH
jgi:CheY-like chemotaxis protein